MLIWYMSTLWKDTPHWVSEHIHHLTYLPLCVHVWTHSSFTVLANCSYTIQVNYGQPCYILDSSILYPFTRFSLFPSLPHPSNYIFFLLSVSMRLTLFLVSTYKWNETIQYFPSLAYFTWHYALQFQSCCCNNRNFFLRLNNIHVYVRWIESMYIYIYIYIYIHIYIKGSIM